MTTKATHTPGPWVSPGTDGDDRVVCAAMQGKRRTLAHVYGEDADARDANANLIAAAPDLLAALEWLAREVRASAPMMRECIGNTNLNALMLREEQARAAIAKAKGETQ